LLGIEEQQQSRKYALHEPVAAGRRDPPTATSIAETRTTLPGW
jgi:hypothetical protein